MIQVNKTNRKIFGEFAKLNQLLQSTPVELAPWKREELNLISFHQDLRKNRGWISKVSTGVVTSIYQEYLAQYIFKSYYFASPSAILFVTTTDYEIGYVFGKKKCDLFINEQYVGQINSNGELVGPRRRRILLEVDKQFDKSLSIKILGREAALINSFNDGDLTISRMLAWEDTQSIEENLLVMVVCLLRNIMMAIPHPALKSTFRT